MERRRQFIAQTQRQRELGSDLPRVVHIGVERVALEIGVGHRNRRFGLIHGAQQEVGEGIAAGESGAQRRVRLEGELAARELVSHLIVILPRELRAEAEGVLAPDPRQVVHKLQGVVVVCVRAFRAVSNRAVADQRDVRDAPGHGRAARKIRDADLAHHIGIEGQVGADGIEEAVVSESRLVDHVGRNHARVGAHVLFVVRNDLRAVERETLVGLVLVAPAIAPRPLRFGGLDEIHAQHESVAIVRSGRGARVVAGQARRRERWRAHSIAAASGRSGRCGWWE